MSNSVLQIGCQIVQFWQPRNWFGNWQKIFGNWDFSLATGIFQVKASLKVAGLLNFPHYGGWPTDYKRCWFSGERHKPPYGGHSSIPSPLNGLYTVRQLEPSVAKTISWPWQLPKKSFATLQLLQKLELAQLLVLSSVACTVEPTRSGPKILSFNTALRAKKSGGFQKKRDKITNLVDGCSRKWLYGWVP